MYAGRILNQGSDADNKVLGANFYFTGMDSHQVRSGITLLNPTEHK